MQIKKFYYNLTTYNETVIYIYKHYPKKQIIQFFKD